MSDRQIGFGSGGDFSPAEVTYVIELLATMESLESIQDLFYKFTNETKKLPGTVVQQIQLKYRERIQRQSELYLTNLKGNPLFHLRIRLDIANKVLKDAMKPRPSHTVKLGEDNYEVVYKADNATALNALKLVIQDLAEREKQDRAKEQETPKTAEDNDPSKNWEIEDGFGTA